MKKRKRLWLLVLWLLLLKAKANVEEKTYEDLVRELQYKRNRIGKLNQKDSLQQQFLSLGITTSHLQWASNPSGVQLNGFDLGWSNDFGSRSSEARAGFRSFFPSMDKEQQVQLSEVYAQFIFKSRTLQSLQPFWGGGFSIRHLQAETENRPRVNEASTLMNGIMGIIKPVSSSSALVFEGGTRFNMGGQGQDRFSFDLGLKLQTEIESW